MSRVNLHSRRRRKGEPLSELSEDVERLSRLVYMDVSSSLQSEQAEEQFTDALTDDDLRIRLMQARPTSLPEALRLAMELESYNEKAPEYEQLKEPKECRNCFWKSGATQGQSARRS